MSDEATSGYLIEARAIEMSGMSREGFLAADVAVRSFFRNSARHEHLSGAFVARAARQTRHSQGRFLNAYKAAIQVQMAGEMPVPIDAVGDRDSLDVWARIAQDYKTERRRSMWRRILKTLGWTR